jgi:hypothetical protein
VVGQPAEPDRIGHDCDGGRAGFAHRDIPGAAAAPGQYQMHIHGSRRPTQVAVCGSSRASTSVTLRQVLGQADQWVVEGCGIAIESLPPGCAAWMTNSTWCG